MRATVLLLYAFRKKYGNEILVILIAILIENLENTKINNLMFQLFQSIHLILISLVI